MGVLIIGYGSIGSRHAKVLTELGQKVAIVSQREIDVDRCYQNLPAAMESEQPDYVVIANKTNEHHSTLLTLIALGFKGTVLVEKPLFHEVQKIPVNALEDVFVAYNLRFNPIIQKLRNMLKIEQVISVQAYVGQYLPGWRPQRDYRLSYSASRAQGGGVLRDLSHELDILNWLLGGWKSATALGGHYSHLEIDSDDVYAIMMTTRKCPIVTVQMNYLDRVTQREIIINTVQHIIKVNLIQRTLQIDDHVETMEIERDESYRKQHQAILNNTRDLLCSMEEGMDVLRLIQAAEKAAYSEQQSWVFNE